MPTLTLPVHDLRPDLAPHLEKSIEAVPRVLSVHVAPDEHRILVEHEGADEAEVLAVLARANLKPAPAHAP